MSNRPDEALLDAVADAPVLAAAVEAHLDAYPLPVDDDEILASAARLEARLGAQPANEPVRWWLIAGVALVAAAAVALMAVPRSPQVTEAPQAVPRTSCITAFIAPIAIFQWSSSLMRTSSIRRGATSDRSPVNGFSTAATRCGW